jgi:hypothetical protein
MPYIENVSRPYLDETIDLLADRIRAGSIEPTAWAGIINYTVTRLLVTTLPKKRYWCLALGIGTLVCVIFEFYRRFVAPYEDEAIRKNGDIKEYQT